MMEEEKLAKAEGRPSEVPGRRGGPGGSVGAFPAAAGSAGRWRVRRAVPGPWQAGRAGSVARGRGRRRQGTAKPTATGGERPPTATGDRPRPEGRPDFRRRSRPGGEFRELQQQIEELRRADAAGDAAGDAARTKDRGEAWAKERGRPMLHEHPSGSAGSARITGTWTGNRMTPMVSRNEVIREAPLPGLFRMRSQRSWRVAL